MMRRFLPWVLYKSTGTRAKKSTYPTGYIRAYTDADVTNVKPLQGDVFAAILYEAVIIFDSLGGDSGREVPTKKVVDLLDQYYVAVGIDKSN